MRQTNYVKNQERNGFEKTLENERRNPRQAKPATIKTCSHSSGHARADNTPPTNGATARRNKTPTLLASSRAFPWFPWFTLCWPRPSEDAGALKLGTVLSLSMRQDLCHCFELLLDYCLVNLVSIMGFKLFSYESRQSS